jgi:signal transduction histidine kinase
METLIPWIIALCTYGLGALAAGWWVARHFRQQCAAQAPLLRDHGFYAPWVEEQYGFYRRRVVDGEEYVSQQLLKLFGITHYSCTLDEIEAACRAEDRPLLAQAMALLAAHSKPFSLTLTTESGGRVLECTGRQYGTGGEDTYLLLWVREITDIHHTLQTQRAEVEAHSHQLDALIGALDSLPFPVWRRNADLRITYCNRAYAEAVERSVEEIALTPGLELDRQVRGLAEAAKAHGRSQSQEMRMVVKGKRRFFTVHEHPYPAHHATPNFIGYAYDITDRHQAENALTRHISAQSQLLDASTSAMAIYGQDQKLTYYNQAFVRLWKLDEAWLNEQPDYGSVLEQLRSKRLLPEQANFRAFKEQQLGLFRSLTETTEEFLHLPDGKAIHVVVIPHAEGGLFFMYEDMTTTLTLERNYNTLIAVQRATLNNLHEAVVVFGEDGSVRLHNPEYARIWELDSGFLESAPHVQEMLERLQPFYDTSDQSWPAIREGLVRHIMARASSSGRLERTDNRVVDWRCVPLPDGAMLIVYYDVTDSTLLERSLRERNEALEAADKLKTQFLANVSYELRSPLTSIMGFTEILQTELFGPLTDKQHGYVSDIYRSSLQLMALINDVLDLASIEAGYMQLNVVPCEVYPLLASIRQLTAEEVETLDIRITLDCPETIGLLHADEWRLKQILFNLVSNAVKFSGEHGRITLGACDEGDHLRFWVQDNGIGIPKDQQSQIFDKFYSSQSGRMQRTGTGMGLAIVKHFVSLHGGVVELESEPGVGTTFTLRFPKQTEIQAQPELAEGVA